MVPGSAGVPRWRNQSEPKRRIWARWASVSTLSTRVGRAAGGLRHAAVDPGDQGRFLAGDVVGWGGGEPHRDAVGIAVAALRQRPVDRGQCGPVEPVDTD